MEPITPYRYSGQPDHEPVYPPAYSASGYANGPRQIRGMNFYNCVYSPTCGLRANENLPNRMCVGHEVLEWWVGL